MTSLVDVSIWQLWCLGEDKSIEKVVDLLFFFFERLNIIIMLYSSQTLACCKEELRYLFVPSHSCCVVKATLAVLGNGSEGSTGKCSEEPEGKAQPV